MFQVPQCGARLNPGRITSDKQYLPSAGQLVSSTDETGVLWLGSQTQENWATNILEEAEKLALRLQHNKDFHMLFTSGEVSHNESQKRNFLQSHLIEQD